VKKTLLAPLLALLLLTASCGSKEPPVGLGRYECAAVALGDVAIRGAGESVELKEDGVGVLRLSGEPIEGSWTLSGTALALTVGEEDNPPYYDLVGTLEGEVLTLEIEGYTCTFLKAE